MAVSKSRIGMVGNFVGIRAVLRVEHPTVLGAGRNSTASVRVKIKLFQDLVGIIVGELLWARVDVDP